MICAVIVIQFLALWLNQGHQALLAFIVFALNSWDFSHIFILQQVENFLPTFQTYSCDKYFCAMTSEF